MSVQARIDTLQSKHSKLEKNIHDAYIKHLSDEEIAELKKQKLSIKDQIYALRMRKKKS